MTIAGIALVVAGAGGLLVAAANPVAKRIGAPVAILAALAAIAAWRCGAPVLPPLALAAATCLQWLVDRGIPGRYRRPAGTWALALATAAVSAWAIASGMSALAG